MSPRFARVRPDMTVDEAISYSRKRGSEHVETIHYAYVLDSTPIPGDGYYCPVRARIDCLSGTHGSSARDQLGIAFGGERP